MMKKLNRIMLFAALTAAFSFTARATTVLSFDGSYRFCAFDGNTAASQVFQENFSTMTIEYWVKPSTTQSDYVMHILRGPTDKGAIAQTYWWLGLDKATHCLTTTFNPVNETTPPGGNGSYDKGLTSMPVPNNAWTHVAAVWTGGTGGGCQIYTNGAFAASYATDIAMTANKAGGVVVFGGTANHGNTARFFKGRMADVRIWRCARSASEIAANYDVRLAGNESGLIGYWKLDDGSGISAADSTANGNAAIAYSAASTQASSASWADDGDLVFRSSETMSLANPVTGSPLYTCTNAFDVLLLPAFSDATEYQATLGTSAAALDDAAWLAFDPLSPPSRIRIPSLPATDGEFDVTFWARGAGATNSVSASMTLVTAAPTVVTRPLSVVMDTAKGVAVTVADVDDGSSDPVGIFSREG